ncbi:MAG TPA: CPBP family intramembrane glutamic endopeptidase [Thermoanaerobaculia bacterium]|nr:CPBP family intramembrane glutamic endopeptidase [Thermoanaerobaculia bacterium]
MQHFFRTRLGAFVLFIIFVAVLVLVDAVGVTIIKRLRLVDERSFSFRPAMVLGVEGLTAFAVLVATLLVMLIGRRSMRELGYGLRDGGKLLAGGSVAGTAAPMLLIAGIAALGGFTVGGVAMHGTQLLAYALAWLVTMFALGLAEELTFRGPGFFLLGEAIGPWGAAAVMTALFVLAHAGKPHENAADLTSVGLIGLFMAFTVIRTGSIWFAVAFHALFDYVALYVLGAPNTANQGGQPIATRLLTGGYHGPAWLTGGVLGIEASWLVFPIIALLFLGFHLATRHSTQSRCLAVSAAPR